MVKIRVSIVVARDADADKYAKPYLMITLSRI